MLVNFTIENWMSFQSPVTFSMVATLERHFSKRLTPLKKYDCRILPISTLYGGNAAGKSNFVEAFSFTKKMITNPLPVDGDIPVRPFKLSRTTLNNPCCFSFDLLIDNNIYRYSFSANSKSVVYEELLLLKSKKEYVCIYKRDGQTYIDKFDKFYDKGKSELLNFVKNVTRHNQLFLANSVQLNINVFKHIYDWFKKQLIIIRPGERYSSFFDFFSKDSKSNSIAENALYRLDTGITHLGYETVPFDIKQLPANIKAYLETGLTENKSIFLNGIIFLRENGEISAKKLKTFHKGVDNFEAEFVLDEESDGTLRAMDLIPAIFNFYGEKSIYIIDEIDRSLHTLLLRKLIEIFLSEHLENSQNQLIMTTHDVLLMDPKLFRFDEMWVAERNSDGASNLIAFSDYKEISKDKDIRKSYLQGRLGGIPNILFDETI